MNIIGAQIVIPSLEEEITNKVEEIKKEAAMRIQATDWRITRYNEQVTLGISISEDLQVILLDRQSIRDANNIAENTVKSMTNIDNVRYFTW